MRYLDDILEIRRSFASGPNQIEPQALNLARQWYRAYLPVNPICIVQKLPGLRYSYLGPLLEPCGFATAMPQENR